MTRKTLAVDFGTSTSAFAVCPLQMVASTPVYVEDTDRPYMETAVLYREGKESLLGHTAVQEFGEATDRERRHYQLRVGFKPDIVRSGEAAEAATDFLQGVLRIARRQHLDIRPEESHVIFGIPSKASNSFQQQLLRIAKQAGFGQVELLEEPIGALLYHLWQQSVSPQEARGDILVVDFGGGTCDFSYLQNATVQQAWGDALLGGRLFDDLFYQWFIDVNPGLEQRLELEHAAYFFHWHECRLAKEQFSRFMVSRDRKECFTRLTRYGALRQVRWEEFVDRAKHYQASAPFLRLMRAMEMHDALDRLDGETDLIEWFRSVLQQGFRHFRTHRIDRVMLSGGSSALPFVPDVLLEELDITQEALLRSGNLFSLIAEGLSLRPALGRRLERSQQQLRVQLDQFVEEELQTMIRQRVNELMQNEVIPLVTRSLACRMRQTLTCFCERGGTMAELRQQLEAVAGIDSSTLLEIESCATKAAEEMAVKAHKTIHRWFKAEGIVLPPHRGTGNALLMDPPAIDTAISLDALRKVAAVVAAVLVAEISGGAGLALIAAGPVGWVIGFVMGALGTYAAWRGVERTRIPPSIARLVLNKSVMKNLLATMERRAEKELRKVWDVSLCQHIEASLADLKHAIRAEIDSLSAISALPAHR